MKNMKVAQKLLLGFAIVAVITLIVGGVGVIGLITINKNEDTLFREGVESLTGINGMYCVIVEQRLELRGIIINIDDEEKTNENVALLREREKEYEELYQQYLAVTSGEDAKENALAERVASIYNGQYTNLKEKMLSALATGDKVMVRKAFDQIGQLADEMTEALYELVTYGNERTAAMNEQDERMANKMIAILSVLAVLSVAVAITLGLYISKLISKPIVIMSTFLQQAKDTGDLTLRPEDQKNIAKLSAIKDEIGLLSNSLASFLMRIIDVSNALEKVSNGDLTAELDLLSEKDIMGLSLQKMIANLNRMFTEIRSSSGQVSTASKQIADGAQSLAQGSTEQASSIQQLSASVSAIAEQTKQNAHIARQAEVLSDAIKGSAEKGNGQMDEMMQAVRDINDASSQIEKVIKIIDDIAFQTNILALNAAVEAARAGQHGKGFAVVAEEVRNLAAKSAEAARDSSGLIENSIEKANYGLTIATDTSASLKEIVDGINQNAEIVAQIALSSEEQAGAIEQINIGIDQVAQVVQQNSATAEQSAAASEQMSGQSEVLAQLISQFRLKEIKSIGFSQNAIDSGEYGRY